MAGEMLGSGGDSCGLQSIDKGGSLYCNRNRIRAERPIADDRIFAAGCHIHHRSEIQIETESK